ncbi:TonB-dependent receptor plug domain-containing protein [Leptothoe sp. PORK10 BA2]|uniref:TonB-dependent receptor plug domain-containing protein n=1 Tax=Leptothoe sp. PORK10 BA2 TaxID=3110254 RepID=UPI002B1F9C90|nr:TonB-dependent receptor [Leptothoe sp. PORK10 BA2]MEA5466246.1 TonB-dependent receptor [Leptothoe sp. PORK10 BA2]
MSKFFISLALLPFWVAAPVLADETPSVEISETLAQTPDLDPDLDDIIRINVVDSILDQPVYSPFRREGTVREATQPVYVINRDQIEAQGARTVEEALRYLPGVVSEGTAGGQLGSQSGQFIRGNGSSQTLILLDGRPINEVGAFGAFDLSNFTTDAVEQIEVLPGGGSVLYGSSAIGGVVNIITRRPLAEEGIETTVGLDVGSFGYNSQTLQVRGNQGDVDWSLGYNRTNADNNFPFSLTSTDFEDTRTNAEVLYNNLNFQLAADLNDRNRLRLGALYLTKDLGVPGGVPVPDSIAGGFNGLTADDNQYTENLLLDLTYEADLGLGEDSLLTARVFGDFVDTTFSDPVADNFFESPSEDKVDQTSLGGQLQHAWQFAENQNITYGIDYRNVQTENETTALLTGVTTTNYDDSINQTGIFARYQVDVTPRFTVNAGVRQDFNDLADGAFTSFNLGTRVALTDTTTFRANFGRNFRVPTLADLFFAPFNNPDLEPETSLGFDVGVDQAIGDRGLWRFTFYRTEVDDAINFDLASFTPQNIGRVESIGIETELNYQVSDDIFAFANYTWNRPEIKSGSNPADEGNAVPFTSADSFNLGLAYEPGDGVYVALFLHGISDVFVDRGNLEELDGRTTVDLKLRLPLADQWALTGSMNNIFDQQFEEFPGFPGVGRNIQVGVKGTF